MPSPTKVLYLAFDACDREIVRELAAAGELPTFQSLLDTAAVAEVDPPPGVYISANWPTFSTALGPDRHDYSCWAEVDPDTYQWTETSPRSAKGTAFWHALADAGHRVAIFDVPHQVVRPDSTAVQILEWGCHDRHMGTSASPPELLDELEGAVGRHPIGQMDALRPVNFAACDFAYREGLHRTNEEAVALWDDILIGVDRKQAASLHLLDKGDWSLFAVVFGESHCTGHQLWAVHDEHHTRHDPTLAALIGDPIRELYRRLDAALAVHLARTDDDTTVYVHLSHGMGPHYDGNHLLDIILQRLHAADDGPRGWRTQLAVNAIGRAPASWQARLLGAASSQIRRHVDAHPPGPLDPWELPLSARSWFQVPNNALGGIRVNLRGREANGVIEPSDYHRVCSDLGRWLSEVVNIDTGEPVVHRVLTTDDHYQRRVDDRLPDLCIEWNSDAPIVRVYSPRIGTIVRENEVQWRTGDHRRHGLLFARGPGITPGVRAESIPMVDVGPTLCAALGVELRDVDGAPVPDLVPAPLGKPDAAPRGRTLPALAPRPSSLRSTLTRLAAEHRATRRLAEHVDVREKQLDGRVNLAAAGVEAHDLRLRNLEREASVQAVTAWVREAEVPETTTVSVVLPTRDRSAIVGRAIDSVLGQTYRRIELVVVDDGSRDETPAVLAKFDDPRMHLVRAEGGGVCAARNRALDVVAGDVVVYLDDDNVMMPLWVKAVVWAFEQRPDADVLYGARLIDDVVRARNEGGGALPSMQFEPYDFERLTRHNFADMSVLAHRTGLPEARFDESLVGYGDWDMFWRLTRQESPLELPVVACHYTTDADARLSVKPDDLRERQAVRAKFTRLLAES